MKPDTQQNTADANCVGYTAGSAVWLTKPDQTKTASLASLRRSLLTNDGAGREVKEAALVEIVARLLNAEASGPDFGPFFMDIDRKEARRQLGLLPNDRDEPRG